MLGALVAWYVGRALLRAWQDYRTQSLTVDLAWDSILWSGVVFLMTYAVLIATWRAVVQQWGDRLSFLDASRIWTVSGLTRYLPGKLWQIPMMAAMATRSNISPVAAAGAAVIGTVVNIAAGFVIALALSPSLLERIRPGASGIGVLLLVVSVAGLGALPWLVPPLAARVTGRSLDAGALPMRAILVALAGNLVAWTMYGIAFRILATGVIGSTLGVWSDWIAVYAISYVLGYIALIFPAGIGVREGAMISALGAAGLADPAQATLLAVTSRVWLTILEIAPGLVFLASGAFRRRSSPIGPQDDAR